MKYSYFIAKLRRNDTNSCKELLNRCADIIEELSEQIESLTEGEVGSDEGGNE